MASRDLFQNALERLESQMKAAARWAAKAGLMTEQSQTVEFVAARITREHLIRESISESCRVWVRHNSWRMMNRQDALFVWERVAYAYKFGEWLHNRVECRSMSENEILLWLLIDSWVHVCADSWKWDSTHLK